ncbi:class I SAM-dependent methyltransferase [Brasilonema octagenarum UFV-E1]|uniref:Class I SAM-dependent methyltransferase n=1 Tax=Brasilonema sennae CENA114 TaxID=415709 RepID=A0A856M8D0_9CYAN|nr:class I SAM-dependent methyltransferase [Brasilonema sennae]QDL07048.1 class I SAM-dependent methyltransferase [Brasilonema sennae CENA114]QDL13410.1 class I SAM-dependent methyltransferase [Brasilonema octagenarum UFV-E1]
MIKTKVDLGIVQETLLIPLWGRASELQQTEPIICDPKSAEILEAIDYDFDKFAPAKNSQIGVCLRGMILDNWVRTYLKQYPQGSVVEIGAGLNTRFERVDNGEVRWFDLDLPDSMLLRKQFFEETERRKFITASALETDWIESVKAVSTEPCLFVAEGVLMYFNEQQVKQLFTNLLEHFPGSCFAFDCVSQFWIKNQKRHGALKYTSAKMFWGISDIRQIQDWDSRYQVMEACGFADLPAKYLQRFPLIFRLLFSYIPLLRNSYRLALMKLG